ncbi:MAG TPA: hypothetical protein VFS54_00515 [Solirubrobacterales bacterium]|nr:hypothetical protein [Solirubrobacterales bacterium]
MIGLATVASVLAAVAPASAAAATEIGSNCAATNVENELAFFDLAHAPAEPLSATAPSSGVITRGKVTVGFALDPGLITVRPQVYRAAGGNQYTLVGEGGEFSVATGTSAFATRIPVQAGDHVGIAGRYEGEAIGLFCQTFAVGDVMAYTDESPAIGGNATFDQATGYRAPISAVIEPDADNDGFGDETQDACPQSAAFQTPCPPVVLSTSTQVKKNSVTVIVTSSTAAPVTVKGVAKLGKGKKAKMNGGTQNLLPGTLNKYRLFFTKGLKNKLKELSPQKKVTLKVTVSGTSVSGAVTKKTLKVKLKGQA